MILALVLTQLQPNRVLELAERFEAQGQAQLAGPEFYRFAVYWPGDSLAPYALFRSGLCYAKAGQFRIAEKVFQRYQDMGYPKSDYARLERARIMLTLGDSQGEALLDSLEGALSEQVAITRAWFALTQDQPSKARELLPDSLKSVLKDFPSGPNPWVASAMSTAVPGTGQLYYGHPGDGFMAFVFSVGFAGVSYYYFEIEDRPIPGTITASLAGFFWLGQAYGAFVGARARRHHLRQNYLKDLKPELFVDRYDRKFFKFSSEQ